LLIRIWELVRYAAENVGRSKLRATLTALGIAIASGALVCMVAFALGMQAQIEAPIEKLGLLNNIEVEPSRRAEATEPEGPGAEGVADGGGGDASWHREEAAAEPGSQGGVRPTPPGLVLDDAALARLETIPGVDYAHPDFRLTQLEIRHDERHRTAYAVGLPREVSLISYFDDLLLAGEFFSLDAQPEALLGDRLLRELGFADAEAAVGQSLQLTVSGLQAAGSDQFSFQRRELTVQVRGVFRAPGFATSLGGHALVLPVDTMRDLPGSLIEEQLRQLRRRGSAAAGYAQVVVRAQRPADVPRIEAQIQEMGFETRAFVTQVAEARRFFLFLELLLAAVGTVALVVSGLGIMNTLLMTVLQRQQEIGIYKALGASQGDIRVLFLTEAGIVGFLGGIAGLALAWLVSGLVQWIFQQVAASQGVEGPVAEFRFPWWLLGGALAYTLLVSVISGLYPAARAARVDPIESLRHG
jgi:ABC-type antimicrobial peptide transport system permease subunit